MIERVGRGVEGLSVNDHVILTFSSCGKCPSCRHEKPFCCINSRDMNFGGRRVDGTKPVRWNGQEISSNFFGQSSFCNPAIVQAHCCVRVNPTYPLHCLAALGCGIQTGAGAIFNIVAAHRPKVKSVAIFGLGGVGCAAVMAAKIARIPKIIAVDIQQKRLELVRELGATHTIDSSATDVQEELLKLGEGLGPDAALECTGVAAVVRLVVQIVGPGGLAVSIGAPGRDVEVTINVTKHIRSCLTYRGTHEGDSNPSHFIPLLVEHWAEGRLPLEKIQSFYSAGQINEAVEAMQTGAAIKPILLWAEPSETGQQ